jgi:type II secretory pathway pseudopilin PulG
VLRLPVASIVLTITEKSVTLSRPIPNPHRRTERGYILITLILFVALLVVAAGVMAPVVAFQVKRDREEELIHRGVQYSRAMKHFVKKFGRYPTRLEELENTNQVRFLRRRYKDPITGKDFKLLRMGDVQMAFGGGLAGATPANGLNPGTAGGVPGGPGMQAGVPKGMNAMALAGGLAAAGTNAGGQAAGSNGPATQNADENTGEETTPPGTNSQGGTLAAAGPGAAGTFGAVSQGGSAPGAQVFGGGPMVGVASTSKEKSIRVFDKKDHYYQWQFIYDPSSDRGGLLTTPNQPPLQGANTIQPGAPGSSQNPNTGAPGQVGPGAQPGPGTQPPPNQQEP